MPCVYIGRAKGDPGLYKIGSTVDDTRRLRAVRGNPYYVAEIVHTIQSNDPSRLEIHIHVMHRWCWTDGEFFRLTDAALANIARITVVNYHRGRDWSVVRRWREEEGLSQAAACARLNVAYDTLRGIETNPRFGGSVPVILKVATALGLPPVAFA